MRRHQMGFTILELMVTLVIIFLVSAISSIAYKDYVQTTRYQVIMAKVEQFRMFQDNFRIDNGRYVAGEYQVGMGFVAEDPDDDLGYVIDNDTDGISFEVRPGTCAGGIVNCYQVVATDGTVTGTWENGAWIWME